MASYTQRRKTEIHDLLGGKCKHCGEKDTRVLQIDHVYGDGAQERRNGLTRMQLYRNIERNTKRYQLLCANCNWKKREKDAKRKQPSNSLFKARSFTIAIILAMSSLMYIWLIKVFG